MGDVMACADIIIARSGANSLYELLALRKPHILIPFAKASRNHQMANARYFADKGLSYVIPENELTAKSLQDTVLNVWQSREAITTKLQANPLPNSTAIISELIEEQIRAH